MSGPSESQEPSQQESIDEASQRSDESDGEGTLLEQMRDGDAVGGDRDGEAVEEGIVIDPLTTYNE